MESVISALQFDAQLKKSADLDCTSFTSEKKKKKLMNENTDPLKPIHISKKKKKRDETREEFWWEFHAT